MNSTNKYIYSNPFFNLMYFSCLAPTEQALHNGVRDGLVTLDDRNLKKKN